MTSIQQLLAEYISEHRAGGLADPIAFVQRAAPADRDKLTDLIDGYLSRTPRRRSDPAKRAGSPAERIVAELEPIIFGPVGWSVLLPQLRSEAKLKRSDLVARLAAELGVADRTEKVAVYYHEMEQDRLRPDGVSTRVLEGLGKLFGRSAEELRAAARGPSHPGDGLTETTWFARSVSTSDAVGSPPAAAGDESDDWDEVDELFCGG